MYSVFYDEFLSYVSFWYSSLYYLDFPMYSVFYEFLSYVSFWYLNLHDISNVWILYLKIYCLKESSSCQVSSVLCSPLINYSGTKNNNNKIFIVKQIILCLEIYIMKLTVIARIWNIMGLYFHNYSMYFGQHLAV